MNGEKYSKKLHMCMYWGQTRVLGVFSENKKSAGLLAVEIQYLRTGEGGIAVWQSLGCLGGTRVLIFPQRCLV